jgi:hypothetical protein
MLDLAFDLDARARIKAADRVDAGAVLVAQRQVEQEVLDRVDAQLSQR